MSFLGMRLGALSRLSDCESAVVIVSLNPWSTVLSLVNNGTVRCRT